jgi:uncharacterized ion transporter superfamily protein YfcC
MPGDMQMTDNSEEHPTEGALLKAMSENWSHARHEEVARERITYLYIFIIAGSLSAYNALGWEINEILAVFLFFLIIFSVVAFFTTIKTSAEFVNHIRAIDQIIDSPRIRLRGYLALPIPPPPDRYNNPPATKDMSWLKMVRVRTAYTFLYILTIPIWICCLANVVWDLVLAQAIENRVVTTANATGGMEHYGCCRVIAYCCLWLVCVLILAVFEKKVRAASDRILNHVHHRDALLRDDMGKPR